MGNVIQKPKVYQYAQPSKVESKRYEGGIGKTILSSGANIASGTIGSIIGAEISDRYNKKAEERMDKRNRQLILDTPSLTTQGRRRAGLNPYGDPILPGMSSQSSTDTSDVAPNSFYEAQQMTLQERIAVRQLENETLVAESQANLNDANADRARGLEGRDKELHTQVLLGQRLANRLTQVNIDAQEFILSFNKEKAPLELEKLEASGDLLLEQIKQTAEDTELTQIQQEIAREEIGKIISETALINIQSSLASSQIDLIDTQIDEIAYNVSMNLHRLDLDEYSTYNEIYLAYCNLLLREAELDETISWHTMQAILTNDELYLRNEHMNADRKVAAANTAINFLGSVLTAGTSAYIGTQIGKGNNGNKVTSKTTTKTAYGSRTDYNYE